MTEQEEGRIQLSWGLVLMGIPAGSLVILVCSTGQTVNGGFWEVFFWLVYMGLASAVCTGPIGLILTFLGLIKLSNRPRMRAIPKREPEPPKFQIGDDD
ncbi:MAG: hypothetical protein ABL949_10800 [Fimbriimonadaceae bacterium]